MKRANRHLKRAEKSTKKMQQSRGNFTSHVQTSACNHGGKFVHLLTTNQGSLSSVQREELKVLKHCFTMTISADYQQSKPIPMWGRSEQPGSTYYLQKVSHDIFGIIDHWDKKGVLYLFDERIGPKNTDHTISLLMKYWKSVLEEYPWMKRLAIMLQAPIRTGTYFRGPWN